MHKWMEKLKMLMPDLIALLCKVRFFKLLKLQGVQEKSIPFL